jgi:hypothetical protein
MRARERAAMNPPVFLDQIDEGCEWATTQINMLQMAQGVMRAFDWEQDENYVAEVIGRAG